MKSSLHTILKKIKTQSVSFVTGDDYCGAPLASQLTNVDETNYRLRLLHFSRKAHIYTSLFMEKERRMKMIRTQYYSTILTE